MIAGPAEFEAAAEEHARRGERFVEIKDDEEDTASQTRSDLPFVLWTVALHHPLTAMVGLGAAAAFAFTGGTVFGRSAGRSLFRAARNEQAATVAQLQDTERRLAQGLDRLGAIQQAARGARAHRDGAAVPHTDLGQEKAHQATGGRFDHNRDVDTSAQWYQEQSGLEQDRPPAIAQDIKKEMRESGLASVRAGARKDGGHHHRVVEESTSPTPHDPITQQILEQLRKESVEMQENMQILTERVSAWNVEIRKAVLT